MNINPEDFRKAYTELDNFVNRCGEKIAIDFKRKKDAPKSVRNKRFGFTPGTCKLVEGDGNPGVVIQVSLISKGKSEPLFLFYSSEVPRKEDVCYIMIQNSYPMKESDRVFLLDKLNHVLDFNKNKGVYLEA